MRNRILCSFGWIVLALTSAAHAQPAPVAAPAPPPRTVLSVTAEGESSQVPDVAWISAGVSTRADDAKAALADNSTRMNQVIAAIRAANVAARDIQTQRISIQPRYRYPRDGDPVFAGYEANNSVGVKLRDTARLGDLLDALAASGANRIDGPYFQLDDPKAAYDSARMAALTTARERAQQYADAIGLRVLRILSIDEGGGFRQPEMQQRVASVQSAPIIFDASTPVSPGETTRSARLTVVFELGD